MNRPRLWRSWAGVGRRGRLFYPEGDLTGTPVSFSPSVRKKRCSQVGRAVLRQDAAVLRYTPRVILTKPAQKLTPFSGTALHVRTHLHLGGLLRWFEATGAAACPS